MAKSARAKRETEQRQVGAASWGPWYAVLDAPGATDPAPAGIRRVQNNRYHVIIQDADTPLGRMRWLSIKRRDQGVIRDWRDLQRIKNELVGPDCEGVELFPAERRLVDTSNQFHLWCFVDPAMSFPFGYADRLVLTPELVEGIGAKQRPWEPGAEPSEVSTMEDEQKQRLIGQLKDSRWRTRQRVLDQAQA